jgi:hypothetical protein
MMPAALVIDLIFFRYPTFCIFCILFQQVFHHHGRNIPLPIGSPRFGLQPRHPPDLRDPWDNLADGADDDTSSRGSLLETWVANSTRRESSTLVQGIIFPFFSFTALKKLHAYRAWAVYRDAYAMLAPIVD